MGTNYYVVPNRPSVTEPIHIGKSSIGWMFLFHEVNEPYWDIPVIWHSYEEVVNWLQKYTVDSCDYVIIDEYDDIIDFDEFIEIVKQKQVHFKDNPDNFTYCKNINGYRFDDREFC